MLLPNPVRAVRRLVLLAIAAAFYARRPDAAPEDVQLAATTWEVWTQGRGWQA